jgi:hypothetical protein
VHLGGITTNPTGAWTAQAGRSLMMRYDRAIRFLIRDGAGQFIGAFDEVFRNDRTTIIRTPPRTPVANAYTERWVASVVAARTTLAGTENSVGRLTWTFARRTVKTPPRASAVVRSSTAPPARCVPQGRW